MAKCLSDAILAGIGDTQHAYEIYRYTDDKGNVSACALGCALIAEGYYDYFGEHGVMDNPKMQWVTGSEFLKERFPYLPEIFGEIIQRNDNGMPREEIAEYVREYECSLGMDCGCASLDAASKDDG